MRSLWVRLRHRTSTKLHGLSAELINIQNSDLADEQKLKLIQANAAKAVQLMKHAVPEKPTKMFERLS